MPPEIQRLLVLFFDAMFVVTLILMLIVLPLLTFYEKLERWLDRRRREAWYTTYTTAFQQYGGVMSIQQRVKKDIEAAVLDALRKRDIERLKEDLEEDYE